MPHARCGGSWLVCGSTHNRLCLAVPLSLQGQSLEWQKKDHGVSFSVEHHSPWPLWGTVAPVQGSPSEAVTSKGITELCTGCVWWVGISTSERGSNAALEIHESSIAVVQIRGR